MRSRLILITAVLAAGCAPIVNIPAQEGDTAMHDPNNGNVQLIMLRALQAAVADRPIEGPFQVILPEGTLPKSYAAMLPQLGENAMWSSDSESGAVPIVAVTQVRIRGLSSEVDVVRPQFPGNAEPSEQTVTVSLKLEPIGGWYVTRMKEWRGDVAHTAVMPRPVHTEKNPIVPEVEPKRAKPPAVQEIQ